MFRALGTIIQSVLLFMGIDRGDVIGIGIGDVEEGEDVITVTGLEATLKDERDRGYIGVGWRMSDDSLCKELYVAGDEGTHKKCFADVTVLFFPL